MFKDKNVLLGVTGSIAAYKTAELVRSFKKLGANMQVIQTPSSLDFITPLTLSTLSDNPVLTEMVDDKDVWNNHVKLALWADFMVIAPVTAKTISKMVKGECDNLLLATYLSSKCIVYFAPAMDADMFKHPSTRINISELQKFGNILIPSGFGELASGLVGEGRMAEPLEIIESIKIHINKRLPLSNKSFLITAGPTYEAIDPVRFLGNRSSGKMGYYLALEAAKQGAVVDLILGPSSLSCDDENIKTHRVESTEEMFNKVDSLFDSSDVSIFSAAVSDFSPIDIQKRKIKKTEDGLNIKFKPTKDIISIMSKKKREDQFMVGFSLETDNEIDNAKFKLQNKGIDMIVLNSLNNKDTCFNHDTNKITIIEKDNSLTNFEFKHKMYVAEDIMSFILKNIK